MSSDQENDAKAEAHRRIAAMREPRRGQIFEHFRGGLYSVVSVSIKEDTLEVLVTYTSNLKGGDTTRTLENFTELIEIPTDRVHSIERPRFRRVFN